MKKVLFGLIFVAASSLVGAGSAEAGSVRLEGRSGSFRNDSDAKDAVYIQKSFSEILAVESGVDVVITPVSADYFETVYRVELARGKSRMYLITLHIRPNSFYQWSNGKPLAAYYNRLKASSKYAAWKAKRAADIERRETQEKQAIARGNNALETLTEVDKTVYGRRVSMVRSRKSMWNGMIISHNGIRDHVFDVYHDGRYLSKALMYEYRSPVEEARYEFLVLMNVTKDLRYSAGRTLLLGPRPYRRRVVSENQPERIEIPKGGFKVFERYSRLFGYMEPITARIESSQKETISGPSRVPGSTGLDSDPGPDSTPGNDEPVGEPDESKPDGIN